MKIIKTKLIKIPIISLIFLIALSMLLEGCSEQKKKSTAVTIGTAELMDLFNPTGQILARIINTDISRNDIVADDITTTGSGENARRLLNHTLDCALVNDIIAVMAYRGDGAFKDYKNNGDLRSMSSFFCDGIIFVVNAESGIKSFADIKGKKIGIADAGSASIGDICKYMLEFYKIKEEHFVRLPYDLTTSVQALEEGKIDGFLYVTAQPNPYLIGLTNSKSVKCEFIPFSKELMEFLKTKYPSLTYIKIPAEMYPNSVNKTEMTTLGSRALLLTTKDMDDDTVYYLTKEICTYFPDFESVYKAFLEVTPKSMAKNLTLPVHPGALKYYEEAGLAKYIPKDLLPGESVKP